MTINEWRLKIMAFFDELGRRISGVSRVAARKAKEMTDIGGLKLQIADENRKLSRLYENLGREYYDMCKDQPDEDLEGLVNQVRNVVEKISGLQQEISQVEAESAAKAEADRLRREIEAKARKEAIVEAEMREVEEIQEPEADSDETPDDQHSETMKDSEAESTGTTAAVEETVADDENDRSKSAAETEEGSGLTDSPVESGEIPTAVKDTPDAEDALNNTADLETPLE